MQIIQHFSLNTTAHEIKSELIRVFTADPHYLDGLIQYEDLPYRKIVYSCFSSVNGLAHNILFNSLVFLINRGRKVDRGSVLSIAQKSKAFKRGKVSMFSLQSIMNFTQTPARKINLSHEPIAPLCRHENFLVLELERIQITCEVAWGVTKFLTNALQNKPSNIKELHKFLKGME